MWIVERGENGWIEMASTRLSAHLPPPPPLCVSVCKWALLFIPEDDDDDAHRFDLSEGRRPALVRDQKGKERVFRLCDEDPASSIPPSFPT